MNISEFKVNKLHIISFIVLLVGLVGAIYLIQTKQIFRSQAAIDLNQALEIKDSKGNSVICSGYTCYTDDSEVYIRIKDLEVLENTFVSPR